MALASSHPYARGVPSMSTSALPPPRAPSVWSTRSASQHRPSTASASDTGSLAPLVSAPASPSPPAKGTPARTAAALTLPHQPFVRQDGHVTLILAGHKAGTALPVYPSGALISGMVVLGKPAAVAAVDVKLLGSLSVREVQGGGKSTAVFLSEQLLAWDARAGAPLPDELAFRSVVPAAAADGRVLPPTFDSRLSAIPGFRVSVQWEVVLTVTRVRAGRFDLFRRTTRLRVPIAYVPRTRPPLQGPFPISTVASATQPRTSFVDLVPTRRQYVPPIQTQIYLPNSQITPIGERIRFRIVLSAPDAYLEPFLTPRALASFLPLGTSVAGAQEPLGPVRVHVARRIGASGRETGVVVLGALAPAAGARGQTLAEGTLQRAERGAGWVGWWGEVRVPAERAGAGGFAVAERLAVRDELVLTLEGSGGGGAHVLPFRQVVGLRLTTDLAGTSSAVRVTEVP
ncbi:hypothetical protein BC834DRAFT_967686 [Gloeopeniophorella convolvens]|nr:hypothetical protein BC834DRAFT_967686 [Gloeopeniophorella convolvens]